MVGAGVEEEKYTSFFSDCIQNGCGEHKEYYLFVVS